MRKLLLLSAVFLFLTGCNQTGTDTPDAERVIRDTVAQQIFQNLQSPVPDNNYVQVLLSQSEQPQPQSSDIQGLLTRLKTAPQKFVIDSRVKAEVKARNGTIVRFAANSLVGSGGRAVDKPVEVKLKECYRSADLLRENIATTCGESVFESTGALLVEATCEGQVLQLKEGEKIEVEFPFEVSGEKGAGFLTASTDGNWQKYEENIPAKKTFTQPQFSYSGLSLQDYLLQTVHYPDYAKANELSARIEATVHIDEAGKVTMAGAQSGYLVFRDEVTNCLKNLPAWTPAYYGEKPVASTVKVSFDFNLRSKTQIQVEVDNKETVYVPLKEESPNNQTASFTTLGWICYGKLEKNKSTTNDVVVPAGVNTDVRIIVKGKNSIVHAQNFTGYTRTFRVKGETQVDVLAIKCESGKVFCSLQPVVLKKQNVVEPQWREVTEAELAALLNQYPKRKLLV